MKYSEYNTLVSLTEKVSAIYNALSDKFVVIKNEIVEDINLPTALLLQKNSKLYGELLQASAIVEDNYNEYQIIRLQSIEIDKSPSEFKLMLNPTLDCNLKCWYCYEKHIKGSKITHNTAENIKKFVNKTFEQNKTLLAFSLSFFGGEPLIGFSKTKELINFIADNCKKYNVSLNISFTSNGVLINKKMVDFLIGQSDRVSFQISLDGGEIEHNKVRFFPSKKGTYRKILQNIQLLALNRISVILRINYTTENLYSIPSILTDLKEWKEECKSYLKIDFQRVWQDGMSELDIDPILDNFADAGFMVSSPFHNVDNLKFSCYADKLNQVLINYNGDVYKCTARDFSIENRFGYLSETGDIVWTIMTPEERIETKMQKEVCKTCSILPLCGGGCSQKCVEGCYGDDCTYGYDENAKKEIVLNRFYNYFVKKHEKSTDLQTVRE
ncbi:MAG: radical SAM protein [Marinilabiliaceae bacterium]|nr:radical SAM protein [Marinilabiliaceae bacterium]